MEIQKTTYFGFRLEEITYEKLKTIAETEDRSIASLIRLILSKYLDEKDGKWQEGG